MEFNVDTWRAERAKSRRGDDDRIDQLCEIALVAQARVKELERIVEDLTKNLNSAKIITGAFLTAKGDPLCPGDDYRGEEERDPEHQ